MTSVQAQSPPPPPSSDTAIPLSYSFCPYTTVTLHGASSHLAAWTRQESQKPAHSLNLSTHEAGTVQMDSIQVVLSFFSRLNTLPPPLHLQADLAHQEYTELESLVKDKYNVTIVLYTVTV